MAFFTAKGRLRRRDYLLRGLALNALGLGVYALPGALCGASIPSYIQLLALLALAMLWYLLLIQTLRRLHDLDLRAWWALVLLLPVVSYGLGIGLQLVQGTRGPNRFGPDPKRPALLPAAEAGPA